MTRRKSRGNGRRAFLALQDKIKAELDAGAFAIAVYAEHERQLGIGYRQFLKYIKRYGLCAADPRSACLSSPEPPARDAQAAPPPAPLGAAPVPQGKPLNARRTEPKRFVFDPTDIDLKKLIYTIGHKF